MFALWAYLATKSRKPVSMSSLSIKGLDETKRGTKMKPLDLIGQKFGRLTVLRKIKTNRIKWECICTCGKTKTIAPESLLRGHTKSCGCLLSETSTKTHTLHGGRKDGKYTPEYRVWSGMKNRCNNPNSEHWLSYGGRGINICDRWVNSFENFLEDMGKKPFKTAQIDRINNDLGYFKENCKWSTPKENSRNKRDSVYILHNGVTLHVKDWQDNIGIASTTIKARIKTGWTIDKAMTIPARPYSRQRGN